MNDERIYILESEYAKAAAKVLMDCDYFLEDGVLQMNLHRFDNILMGFRNGCIFGIRINDVTQPHFCLIVGDEQIAYNLDTGRRLMNETGYEQLDEFVHVYWELDRVQLAGRWNQVRRENQFSIPSDWEQDQDLSNAEQVVMGIQKLYEAQPPKNVGNNHGT